MMKRLVVVLFATVGLSMPLIGCSGRFRGGGAGPRDGAARTGGQPPSAGDRTTAGRRVDRRSSGWPGRREQGGRPVEMINRAATGRWKTDQSGRRFLKG